MKPVQHIPGSSTLNFLQGAYVSHSVGVPYCWGKFHNWTYKRVVCSSFYDRGDDLQISSKEAQGMVSLGANICNVSVPL